jgi:peptidoglycan/LPS O-acetylase OafA/YrhL
VTRRIVELDGLRGLAALTVIVAHYFGETPNGFDLLKIGWLGVNIFFVLSGFLIGSIIFDQGGQPNFFKSFYFRRAARIIPIYVVVVTATCIAALLTQGHVWSDQPFSPGIYATFMTNMAMAWQDDLGSMWLRPVWTLAVEEQFYLTLPLLIVFLPRRWLMPVLAALWFASLIFRIAYIDSNVTAAWVTLPARMDLLLTGVMLVMIYRQYDLSRHLMAIRIIPLVAAVTLAIISNMISERMLLITCGSISSIGIACFILGIFYGSPEGVRYRGQVLRWFGQISYCLYLVHQPVSGVLHGLLLDAVPDFNTPASFAVTLLSIGVSIGIAAASWRWFEQPILNWAATRNAEILNPAPAKSSA